MIVTQRCLFTGKVFEIHPKKVFLGECIGVALEPRGPDDSHVVFYTLVEDDGNWHVASVDGFSSVWINDLFSVVEEARRWMIKNCDKDGTGWKFHLP